MISDNIRGSVLKHCIGLIAEIRNAGVGAFEIVDWDNHANLHEIPDLDLLGPASLAWTDNGTFCEIAVTVGVSTFKDVNLFRNWGAIGRIYESLRPGKQIPYYDAETQQIIGYMVSTEGVTVAPMSRAEVRPFQYVQASLVLDGLSST